MELVRLLKGERDGAMEMGFLLTSLMRILARAWPMPEFAPVMIAVGMVVVMAILVLVWLKL